MEDVRENAIRRMCLNLECSTLFVDRNKSLFLILMICFKIFDLGIVYCSSSSLLSLAVAIL